MSVTIESTKKLKRQVVVPFEGEEKFVVPKKGGFGQIDNEHYVMVTGSTTLGGTTNVPSPSPSTNTQIGTDVGTTTSTTSPTQVGTSTITTVTGASTPQTTIQEPTLTPIVPTTTTTPPRPQLPTTITLGTDTTPTPPLGGTSTPSQAQLDCEANGGIWSNGTCTNPRSSSGGTIDTIPTFPNWDTLTCESLKAKISELESTMATSRFAQNVVDAYNSQLAYARSLVTSKCYVAPPTTIVAPIPPVGGGGVFGGGGGGGFGQEPSVDMPQVEEKSNIGLFLVIGVIGGLYFLLRKK